MTADEAERRQIAEALDLVAIDRLSAEVSVKPWRREGVRVSGTVRAAVSQPCVVTLEPVPGTVEEAFTLRLDPEASEAATVDIDPDSEDPPERLESDVVDIGAIVLEHFVLGLDPYPRAEGVAFEGHIEDDEPETSPFAALKTLKDRAE